MDNTDEPGVLIIFTRVPEPGNTKTRLIPALGAERAARLHRQLLMHTVSIASESLFDRVEIHASPHPDHPFLQELSGAFNAGTARQTGVDLGERMLHALSATLTRHAFAVLVGCDCPLLDRSVLDNAYTIMEQKESDVVLGPSTDGGYYLIGMRRAEPLLFRDITWGTAEVLSETRLALTRCGLQWQEIRELWDVDVPADLEKIGLLPGFSEFSRTGTVDA